MGGPVDICDTNIYKDVIRLRKRIEERKANTVAHVPVFKYVNDIHSSDVDVAKAIA